MRRILLSLVFFTIAIAAPGTALAKRTPPPVVKPCDIGKVRYTAPNDDGFREHIQAWDLKTNKQLWDVTVFTNPHDPQLEEDVQHVYITTMAPHEDGLIIKDERNRSYYLNLKTREVTRLRAKTAKPSD